MAGKGQHDDPNRAPFPRTPPGSTDAVLPFASRATNGIQTLTGFIQSISSVNYLRIAQQSNT